MDSHKTSNKNILLCPKQVEESGTIGIHTDAAIANASSKLQVYLLTFFLWPIYSCNKKLLINTQMNKHDEQFNNLSRRKEMLLIVL